MKHQRRAIYLSMMKMYIKTVKRSCLLNATNLFKREVCLDTWKPIIQKNSLIICKYWICFFLTMHKYYLVGKTSKKKLSMTNWQYIELFKICTTDNISVEKQQSTLEIWTSALASQVRRPYDQHQTLNSYSTTHIHTLALGDLGGPRKYQNKTCPGWCNTHYYTHSHWHKCNWSCCCPQRWWWNTNKLILLLLSKTQILN